MSKPVSKTAVGAFVLCALTLFVLSILWLAAAACSATTWNTCSISMVR